MAGENSREKFRDVAIQARNALSPTDMTEKNSRILDTCLALEEYKKANVVFIYCSKGSEVDTRILIKGSLASAKKVVLPRCIGQEHLEVRLIQKLDSDCVKGAFGILEPCVEKTVAVEVAVLEILFIPGIAFDSGGNRMGYGRGFFDRFLAGLKPTQVKVGLAYEIQVCRTLLAQPHDVKMDILVTEDRVIRFKH